jgi:hypothetical protein
MTERTGRARAALLAGGLIVGAVSGCGAKTGLQVPCAIPLEPGHADVLLVLDRSGSMSTPVLSTGGPTYWETVLEASARVLPEVETSLNLGVTCFPWGESEEDRCTVMPAVGVAPGPNRAGEVMRFLQSAGEPAGNTPTFAAIATAAEYLRSRRPVRGPQFIVLATDGEPNCNLATRYEDCDCDGREAIYCWGPRDGGNASGCLDTVRVVEQLRGLAAEGIYTLVIGVISEEVYAADLLAAHLDAMAIAGGRPRGGAGQQFYRAQSPEEIRRGFEDALLPLSYCQLRVADGEAAVSDHVALQGVGSELIARDPTHRDGWDWSDGTRRELEVFGAACERLVAARTVPVLLDPQRRCWAR